MRAKMSTRRGSELEQPENSSSQMKRLKSWSSQLRGVKSRVHQVASAQLIRIIYLTPYNMKLAPIVVGGLGALAVFECTYAYPGMGATVPEIEQRIQTRQQATGYRRLPSTTRRQTAEPAHPNETVDSHEAGDPNEVEDPIDVECPRMQQKTSRS